MDHKSVRAAFTKSAGEPGNDGEVCGVQGQRGACTRVTVGSLGYEFRGNVGRNSPRVSSADGGCPHGRGEGTIVKPVANFAGWCGRMRQVRA
jgi:hypothetical protein